ncbi:MAG: hypothetical protein PHH12_00105 [Candidatus Shapirobacteria bacterium]|nr:hypothetical protein [Candidatus Shapirobacteria bacterium]
MDKMTWWEILLIIAMAVLFTFSMAKAGGWRSRLEDKWEQEKMLKEMEKKESVSDE